MFVENTAAFMQFSDFGVTAEFGSQRAVVIFDAPDSTLLGDHVQTTDYAILYQATDLVDLAHGDWVVVSGDEYECVSVSNVDDGAFKRALLQKVTS